MKELKKSGLYEVTQKESEEMKRWREEELLKRWEENARREIAAILIQKGFATDEIVEISKLRKSSVEKLRRELGR
jgi:hypothetical protein